VGAIVKIVKRLLLGLCVMISLVVAVVLFCFWDAAQNRGWEFGYFEQYNRMRHLLLELPGVMIVNERHTHDVVLARYALFQREGLGADYAAGCRARESQGLDRPEDGRVEIVKVAAPRAIQRK
jgi:hypothetical protein